MSLDSKKLQFWLKHRLNVLIQGEHGVGKTTVILQAFERAGLKWAYFSGATLDPFIDFVGVPVKVEPQRTQSSLAEVSKAVPGVELVAERKQVGTGAYIEMIRPKHLASGDIQVIMIDEFNRSHKKVRNACMELIQFGTINGVPLVNDRNQWHGVWAAINPDSTDENIGVYDTDRLDPAQRDRFQIQVTMPYECDAAYFERKYGERNGKAAVQYWSELPENIKKLVSPRRLDYAMEHYERNGDVRDVLPNVALPQKLTNILVAGPAGAKLQNLYDTNNQDEAKALLADEQSYNYVLKSILENKKFMSFFLPLMPSEKLASLYGSNREVRKVVISELKRHNASGTQSPMLKPLMEIARANQNTAVASKIRDVLDGIGEVVAPSGIEEFVSKQVAVGYLTDLKQMSGEPMSQTHYRTRGYEKIQHCLPQDMPNEAALLALTVLDKLGHSYANTIQTTMPKYVAMANHCLCALLRNGMPMADVENQLKTRDKLVSYMRRSQSPTLKDLELYVRNEAKSS